jgi:hypothetical protein
MDDGVRAGQRRRSLLGPSLVGLSVVGLSVLGIGLGLLVAPAAVADPEDSGEPAPAVSAVVSAAPADGVPHLPSPDNLPPGTTQAAPEGPKMSYLRYLWQAVQTPGITMSDALVLIAQRPMDAQAPVPTGFPPQPASP